MRSAKKSAGHAPSVGAQLGPRLVETRQALARNCLPQAVALITPRCGTLRAMVDLPLSPESAPVTIQGPVRRLWKGAAGEQGCLLVTPDGEQRLTGPLPPLRTGQILRATLQGHQLLRAERVVPEREIAHAFYGMIGGKLRPSVLKIVKALGDETHDLITRRPSMLSGVKGIPPSGITVMQKHARKQGRLYSTLRELADLGLPPEHARILIRHQGAGAARSFQHNPFLAIQHGVPLDVLDHAALRMGLSRFDPRRHPALAYELVSRACVEHGHTCLPERALRDELQERHALESEEITAALLAAQGASLLTPDRGMLFLPEQHRLETRLADDLIRVLTAPVPALPLDKTLTSALSDEQRSAVHLACTSALCVVTGGPGTGKTTTLRALLGAFDAAGLTTVLCAPTGKAASRMTASTGREATTLHRLLGYDGEAFEAGVLQADAIVIDEASMTGTELFGMLMRGVPTGARVVLVGDEDQLPPVDPGHPLAALVRSVPTCRLKQTHRQVSGSPILTLAGQLISGEPPHETGVRFEACGQTRELVNLVESLVNTGGPPMVLTAGKAGSLGTVALNTALQEALNPGTGRFRAGDPVTVTRNDHTTGLMNGMTGRVTSILKGQVHAEFDGTLHAFGADDLTRLALAYAVTIHRSQGSEWERVVVVLSEDHARLLNRNLAYTAVTRAKVEVVACGARGAWNRAAITPAPRRHSLLEARLRE